MMSLVLAAFLLAYGGMVGLCLGLERHFKQVWRRSPSVRLRFLLRGLGWLALLASLALSAAAWGWAMGPVAWLGLVSLAALALVLLLPYAARGAVLMAGLGWPVVALLNVV